MQKNEDDLRLLTGKQNQIIKELNSSKCQPGIPYPAKISFKNAMK
jgi:hypothetical protein